MPLPVDLTTITVTGSFPSGGGNPLSGTVTFTPSTDLTDSTGHVIIRAAPVEASLDYTGSFTTVLVCTDNTDLSPSGWTWTVTERIVGLAARVYSVLLPHTDGPTIDLAALIEVTPVTPPAGALLAVNNLADLASPGVSRNNLGLGPLATIAESGNAGQYLNGQGGWSVPSGGGGGGVQIGGDLGGTNSTPAVTGTHLASPLPLAQGGTNAADAPGARIQLGLGSAATQPATAFDASGAAAAALASAQSSAAATYVPLSAEGAANGVATLDSAGHLTGAQAANLLAAASNLSDLASSTTARANLGLGGSATLSVGTTAGTVAAGDDSRITGAAQKASNLADLASTPTARTNLGLGTAATENVNTTAGTIAALGAQAAGATGLAADAGHVHPTTGLVLASSLPLSIANGGSGQTAAGAAFNALSPVTTLGDTIYGSGANTSARLAGNTTAAKQFLTQTGTGAVSAAPAWAAIAGTDLPSTLYDCDVPADRGLVEWNFPVLQPPTTQAFTSGTVYGATFIARTGKTVTKLGYNAASSAVTPTAGQNFAAVYSVSGTTWTQIATIPDQSTWGPTGQLNLVSLNASVTFTAGATYAVLFISVAGTAVQLRGIANSSMSWLNSGLGNTAAPWYKFFVYGTAQTTLPGSFTASGATMTQTNALSPWFCFQ